MLCASEEFLERKNNNHLTVQINCCHLLPFFPFAQQVIKMTPGQTALIVKISQT